MAEEEGCFDPESVTTCLDDGSPLIFHPESPPMAEVDDSPLQNSMGRNKESLKVKLMLRRPINQLVAQGIMPQLKTSPTIHEQRQKLERAKMGDLLKAKIQQRPDRQELVRQHILEADVGHVDPSLAERQRMLKKCRLVDSLNDQLSHRPGPLELIKKNILHTEEPIERAVKEGHIEFKATSEGQKIRPEPPDHYMTIDDDSQSSDAQSPRNENSSCNTESHSSFTNQKLHSVITTVESNTEIFPNSGTDLLKTAAAQAGIMTVVVAPNNSLLTTSSNLPLGSSIPTLTYLNPIVGSDGTSFTCSPPVLTKSKSPLLSLQQPAPGKEKNRKKSKSKSQQQKTRTIKFHEYKGPASAQKNVSSSNSNKTSHSTKLNPAAPNLETSYELLLQQQQLFLQWQLELKQKYPQIILPVNDSNSPSPSVMSLASNSQAMDQSCNSPRPASPPPPPPLPPPPPPPLPSLANTGQVSSSKPLRNLEDMKVSDLKAELKKRNLRVSGAKTRLIERLKQYTENSISNVNHNSTLSNFFIPFNEECLSDVPSPLSQSVDKMEISSKPNSPQTGESIPCSDSMNMSQSEPSEGDIIREQQRKIEELQKQLLNSQLLLQQQQRRQQQQKLQQTKPSQTFQGPAPVNAKANLAAFLYQQQQTNAVAKHQKLQKQGLKQLSNNRQKICNNDNMVNAIDSRGGRNVNVAPANNKNIIRNINNNIVIMNSENGQGAANDFNGVTLGDQPSAVLLNSVIKCDGREERTLLPSIIGTVMQPQMLISSQGVKQLVLNPKSMVLPDNVKLINGTIMATNCSHSADDTTSMETNDTMNVLKLNNNIAASSQSLPVGDNIVTLHVDQEDVTAKNEPHTMQKNCEMFELFVASRGESVSSGSKYDEVLLEREKQQRCFQTMQLSNTDVINVNNVYKSAVDASIPSNHLSLEELGIDMGSFPMDLPENQNQPNETNTEMMDVDNDWLDKLLSSGPGHAVKNISTVNSDVESMNNNDQDPLGLFGIDENVYKSVAGLSWDTVDFAK